MKKLLLATVALVTLVIPKISQASPIIFTASDPSAVPGGSFPNSLAEAALFASAASGVQTTVTFESSSVGAFTNLTIAPGVTINGSDFQMNPQQILSAPL